MAWESPSITRKSFTTSTSYQVTFNTKFHEFKNLIDKKLLDYQ